MSFKELTGLARSHVVGDLVSMLESRQISSEGAGSKLGGASEPVFTITMDDLKECLSALSSGVLAREKECYQL